MVSAEKVTIAVAGKFHAFHLANEYATLGKLETLYASHRTIKPPKQLTVNQYKNRLDLALRMHFRKIPLLGVSVDQRGHLFDEWTAKVLVNKPPAILHSWNGASYKTFKALQGKGWLRCIERSCPHNQFQYDLLAEEADRLGLTHHQDKESLKLAIEELYLADVIVAPSTYSANSYTDQDLVRKVRVNRLGANVQYKERATKHDSKFIVLMVGNQFLRKGTHYLIEAFKQIEDDNAELWIRGDVPESYLTRINDKRIKVIPPLLPDKLWALYQAADVFVQPSVDEGFGMTVFEALAFGLPLVVTENVGAKDLLTPEVSVVVPIRDPQALAKAISQAANLPSQQFDEARKKLLIQVSWRDTASRMFDTVYQR